MIGSLIIIWLNWRQLERQRDFPWEFWEGDSRSILAGLEWEVWDWTPGKHLPPCSERMSGNTINSGKEWDAGPWGQCWSPGISLSLKQVLFPASRLRDSVNFIWAPTVLDWILLVAAERVVSLPLEEVERRRQEWELRGGEWGQITALQPAKKFSPEGICPFTFIMRRQKLQNMFVEPLTFPFLSM